MMASSHSKDTETAPSKPVEFYSTKIILYLCLIAMGA
jgi:hypothetical protein